jgi:hypothetical protein
MENAFKIKKGLIVNASGSTAVDIQGNSGQLFSITDSLTGVLMSVNDVSGLPILEVSDTNRVKMGTFGAEGLIVEGSTVILPNTGNNAGDILTIGGNNKIAKRTAAEILTDIGAQAALTNPVTGTGLSGQVSFFNGTTTQTGDNGLFWDNSNKRLGIGTTSPQSPLQVGNYAFSGGYARGTVATFAGAWSSTLPTLTLISTDTTSTQNKGGSIAFAGGSEAGSTPYIFAQIKGLKELTGGTYSGYMAFYTTPAGSDANTERMRITAAGNVGIGTTSPSRKLHVYTSNDRVGYFESTNTVSSIHLINSNTSFDSSVKIFSEGDDLGFSSGNAERVRILSSGNVGIGTNSPTSLLTLRSAGNSTVRFEDSGTTSVSQITRQAGTGLEFIVSTSARDFFFKENANNLMVIEGTGNVGIGTTSPDRAIHLVDTNTSSGYTTSAILGSGNNLNLYQLHVNSNSNTTTEAGILLSHTVSGNTAQWGISTQRTGSNVGNLIFRTRTAGSTSAEVMRMDSSGNVSIGTTATSHVLRIQGTPRIDSTGQTPSKLTVGVIEEYIASSEIENPAILAEPDVWLRININGTNYVVPAYAAS